MSRITVNTEIGPLRRVLMCCPEMEQEMVHPEKMFDLLYDDLVWLEPMKKTHDLFTESLIKLGVEVVDSRQLLKSFLSDTGNKEMVLQALLASTNPISISVDEKEMHDSWMNLSPEDCTRFLIMGTFDDGALPLNEFVDPIPNFIFTRDYGGVIGNMVLPANFAKWARRREGLIARLLFENHPEFDGTEIFEIGSLNGSHSLEGGDIMILREDVVCIGVSERSSVSAVRSAVKQLHSKGITNVITVVMPKDRSCMHLDTIFTMINHDECLVFPHLIEPSLLPDPSSATPVEVFCHTADNPVKQFDTLLLALSSLGINLNPIACGGSDPLYQAREQWTDGANALTVRPGLIYQYMRNYKTIAALADAGYKIVDVREFVSGEETISDDEKAVITLPCYEMARARGGSHCLTFPLFRDPL